MPACKEPEVTPATENGEPIVLLREPATGSVAAVAPTIGSNLFRFHTEVGGKPLAVIASPPDLATLRKLPTRWRAGVLFPYPGVVSNSAFCFRGEAVRLLPDPAAAQAMHGIVRRRAWRVTAMGADAAHGAWVQTGLDTEDDKIPEEEWPFPFAITLTIQLQHGRLRTIAAIRNKGERPMPFNLGFHPYFPTPLGPAGDMESCEIEIPADYRWSNPAAPPASAIPLGPGEWPRHRKPIRNIEVGLVTPRGPLRNQWFSFQRNPSGAPRLIGRLVDTANQLQVDVNASAEFTASVFYTPPGISSASLEPHTGLPNAFNLSASGQASPGLSIIGPGGDWSGWYEIEAKSAA